MEHGMMVIMKIFEMFQTKADTEYLNFQAEIQKEILERFPNWREFRDESIKREFQFLSIRGPATMPPADVAAVSYFKRNFLVFEVCIQVGVWALI